MKKTLQDEKFCLNFQASEFQVKTASTQEQEIRTNVFSSLLSISSQLDELGLSKSAKQILQLFSFAQQEAENKKDLCASKLFFTISGDQK